MQKPPPLKRHPRLLKGALQPRLPRVPPAVERWVWLSRLAVFAENLWPALWPALALAGVFLIVSFLDLWRFWNPALQALAVLGLLGGAAWLAYRAVRDLRFPGRQAGLRRLERDSGLAHRPLTAFEDELATGDKDAGGRKLWAAHKARQILAWRKLNLAAHDGGLARTDPYALRLPLLLAVALSGLIAGPDWDDRLGAAFLPMAHGPADGVAVDVWVTPPEYTGAAPIFLTGGAEVRPDKIRVPVGSQLTARVSGTNARVELSSRPDSGPRSKGESTAVGDGVREAHLTLDGDTRARLRVGRRTVGSWRFSVTPDRPPQVAFSAAPSATPAGQLKLAYKASDDYGVAAVGAQVTLVPNTDDLAAYDLAHAEAMARAAREAKQAKTRTAVGSKKKERAEDKTVGGEPARRPAFHLNPAKPVSVNLPLSGGSPQQVEESAVENLASHPWAGREVLVQLAARDAAGQKGFSDGVKLTLPERRFTKPLALALIEQRKALARDPYAYPKVAKVLGALLIAPEKLYDDTVIFLGLRSAHWRLTEGDVDTDDLESVFDLLWDLALRVEDGELSEALARLREAQQALMDALKNGASEEELRKLMAELRAAMEAYIQALLESGERVAELPEGMGRMMDGDDLASLLEKLQQLTETGAHEAARNLLADLAALMENLRIAKGGAGGGLSPQEQALSRTIEELGELIGRQRNLLDETFRGAQQAQREERLDNQLLFAPPDMPLNLAPQEDLENGLGRAGPGANLGANRLREHGEANRGSRKLPPGTPPVQDFTLALPPSMAQPMPAPPADRSGPQQGLPGAGPGKPRQSRPGADMGQDQRAIRGTLKDLAARLKDQGIGVPDSFGEAGEAMGEAAGTLDRDDLDAAIDPERRAIEHLRDGARSLAKDLAKSLSKRRAFGVGGGAGRDPLGRMPGDGRAFNLESSVRVPDESALQRAREILEELRNRAAERNRPQPELDYLDRLLKRF